MDSIQRHFNSPWLRLLQHLLFWLLSFFAFLYLFKIGSKPERIDYIYTAIFHITFLPPVYINLLVLIPFLKKGNHWGTYFIFILLLIAAFSWINFSFFSEWSNKVLPDYFFIAYFSFLQVAMFFTVYVAITSLLKLSKSWFTVIEMQRRLLETDKQKLQYEKQLIELEARALRAQMNPHFIFNCLNSIKSLMQEKETDKGIAYLTTFSKLIRTLFNNADKREIMLYDEIETCKLYLQLEAMRFDTKFSYTVNMDPGIDLKSVFVPALIIQPFIENAIWHGIMPQEGGGHVSLSISKQNGTVEIIVDDNGIGRVASQKGRHVNKIGHQSKGVNLTQSRLELDNLLQQRKAKLEITDKEDSNGTAMGTRVVLHLSDKE